MKEFITIADEVIERMGKAPYDDKKTREYIKKITERTLDEHEQTKKIRERNKK